MLKEQAISLLTQVKEIILGSESWLDSTHQPIEEAFSMAIKALKQPEPCEDTISRQAAIDAVHKNYDTILDFKSDGRTVADSFEDIINTLPSAQPEIIRCEKCEHYTALTGICEVRGKGLRLIRRPDDFCSRVERRGEKNGQTN